MNTARVHVVGRFEVATDVHSDRVAAMVRPTVKRTPIVFFIDEDADGTVDNVSIVDLKERTVSVTDSNADGQFDSLASVTGMEFDSVSFEDSNLDGRFDHCIGPERAYAVMIDSRWHDVIRVNDEVHVRIDGGLVKLELIDGRWMIPDRE